MIARSRVHTSVRGTLRECLSVCALLTAFCATVPAGRVSATVPTQSYDPKRNVVVFGGFGYFDEGQQRWLTALIRRDASERVRFPSEGQRLEAEVSKSARATLGAGLKGWSAHPVVFDSDGLGAAFTAATGDRAGDTREMFSEFDRAYMIVLTSGFEHQSMLRMAYEKHVTHHAYTAVSVSASLVDLRSSGNILLSTSAFALTEGNQVPKPDTEDSDVWAGRFALAYAGAAQRALSQLRALADRTDPRAGEKSWDTYMVTGAMVPNLKGAAQAEARQAAAAFDWKLSDDNGDVCRPNVHCVEGSKACGAMRGFLVNAVSSALSQAGYTVLPPVTWRDTTRRIDDIARYRLMLPGTPLPELASSTDLDFDPRRATYKVVAYLGGVASSTGSEKFGVMETDVHTATVDGLIARTEPDPDACVMDPKERRRLDGARKGLGEVSDRHPVGEPPLDIETRRFQYLRAIYDAVTKIAQSQGGSR